MKKNEQIKKLSSLLREAMSYVTASNSPQGTETFRLQDKVEKLFREIKRK